MYHGKPATTLSLLFIMKRLKWFWLLSLVLWLLMTGIVKKLLVHLQKHWTINWHTQTYLYNVHGNAETHTNSTYITAIINRKMSELQFHQHIKKRLSPPQSLSLYKMQQKLQFDFSYQVSIHISSWEWALFFGRFLG